MFYELLSVVVTSVLPISELRGSIPLGLALGLDPITVIIISIIFNSLIFFPIYFGADFFYKKFLHKWKFVDKIILRAHKHRHVVDKYGIIGLAIFVGIPLPMTGAWTGSILAWILKLEWKRSFIAVLLGVIMAAVIISSISLGILKGLEFLL